MNVLKAYFGVGAVTASAYTATYLATRTTGDISIDSTRFLGRPLPGYVLWTWLYITFAWPIPLVRSYVYTDSSLLRKAPFDVFQMYPLDKLIEQSNTPRHTIG